MRDAIHELRIAIVFKLLMLAESVSDWANAEFKRLLFSRRPSQVSKMEQRKGLI